MKSDSWGAGSDNVNVRFHQDDFDEGVSAFVVECLVSAFAAYPRPLEVARISAEPSVRKIGEQMLQTMGQEGLVSGELTGLKFTLSGYLALQRAKSSNAEFALSLQGTPSMTSSEFILVLLREYAAGGGGSDPGVL